jgi:hypothetical protein
LHTELCTLQCMHKVFAPLTQVGLPLQVPWVWCPMEMTEKVPCSCSAVQKSSVLCAAMYAGVISGKKRMRVRAAGRVSYPASIQPPWHHTYHDSLLYRQVMMMRSGLAVFLSCFLVPVMQVELRLGGMHARNGSGALKDWSCTSPSYYDAVLRVVRMYACS